MSFAYNLSRDHKPGLEIEKEIISKVGGFILAGTVNGSLNLTRALGNLPMIGYTLSMILNAILGYEVYLRGFENDMDYELALCCNEFNIEKLKLVEADKKKICQEYERHPWSDCFFSVGEGACVALVSLDTLQSYRELASCIEVIAKYFKYNRAELFQTKGRVTPWRMVTIAALSRFNHNNFTNLISYYEEDEPFTRMVVFEYAPNRSLNEHLHVKDVEHLDWSARMMVIMGTTYCLHYMSHDLNPPVSQSNLNPISILLTYDFAAKVNTYFYSIS
ncbi:hypothetical protein RYX36_005821, partial [Vicia faba]